MKRGHSCCLLPELVRLECHCSLSYSSSQVCSLCAQKGKDLSSLPHSKSVIMRSFFQGTESGFEKKSESFLLFFKVFASLSVGFEILTITAHLLFLIMADSQYFILVSGV